MLSQPERTTILEHWNATAHAVGGSTLPELFCAQAQRTPDAVALVYQDRTLSYAALEAHANRLAHHLRGLGVGPETVVGLCVERSIEMVIGLLGILKAGAAYLPLDPHYPAERLSFMLADARAPVLVTPGPAAGAAAGASAAGGRWCGSTPTGRRSRAPRTTPPHQTSTRDHPAYVIYTSGSTGTPKGVVVTHAGIASNLMLATQFDLLSRHPIALLRSASLALMLRLQEIAAAGVRRHALSLRCGRAESARNVGTAALVSASACCICTPHLSCECHRCRI